MALRKNPKVDLRRRYHRTLEISMIVTLSLLIAAFKFVPVFKYQSDFKITPQDIFNGVEPPVGPGVVPPPPPEPLIPIESPEDVEPLKNIEFDPTEIFIDEPVGTPPPPKDNEGESIPKFFAVVEEQPEPIGGIAAIQARIKYPEIAIRANVQGMVQVLAYVDELGNVVKVEVVRGIGAGCDEAAVEAVMATKFKPGKQRGRPVKVKMGIPIRFTPQ